MAPCACASLACEDAQRPSHGAPSPLGVVARGLLLRPGAGGARVGRGRARDAGGTQSRVSSPSTREESGGGASTDEGALDFASAGDISLRTRSARFATPSF